MFVKFSEKAQKALVIAESSAYHFGQNEVTTIHLLLSLLKMTDLFFTKALKRYMVTDKKILEAMIMTENELTYLEYSEELRNVIEKAMKLAVSKKVSAELLGIVLLSEPCQARELLKSYGVDIDLVKSQLKEKKENHLTQIPELIDLNEKVRKNNIHIIGRENELHLLMEMLCRKEKNNAIIVGDAGVGKTALVEKLAGKLNDFEAEHPLYGKRIYELDLASVIAGTKYRGDFEEKLKRIIQALKEDRNSIVFIDEIHNLVDAGKAEGAIDASNILKPYLARGEITCIGATTYQEYKKYFEKDPALNRRFAKIDLKEESEEDIFLILKGLKNEYEIFHHIQIQEAILKEIIRLTNRYMKDRHQPDKALDVLDLCCVKTRMKKETLITENTLNTVMESLCGFRINDANELEELEKYLSSVIFGQKKAIQSFCKALSHKKSTFLFLGPKGVGKTEMIKQSAKFLNRHLIQYHMEEFKDSISLSKLIGPNFGYEKPQLFIDEVRRYPESFLLLEDIHLAHPHVLRFFLKLIEEQEYEKVDFSHVIFIFISNQMTKGVTGFMKKKSNSDVLFPGVEESVDEVIQFETLSKQSIKEILEHKEVKDEKIIQELLNESYDESGARLLFKRLKEKQSEFPS